MYVVHRFELDHLAQDHLNSLIPKFGYNGYGELIYYRTYSRIKSDGGQEDWADTVIRVTNGTFSIRKDFYLKNHIPWDESHWQNYAFGFAKHLFQMKWMPPGRGLWAMGSDFVYERGAMALYNCAYTNLGCGEDFAYDVGWLMDALMHGVGVGFGPLRDGLCLQKPAEGSYDNIIDDNRESWVESCIKILIAYILGKQLPYQIYDRIRPAGLPIKGFGGISSGPDTLRELHTQLIEQCELFLSGAIDVVQFKTNVANLTGCCVVSGNVRRSAELGTGSVWDPTFLNLKDYSIYPNRAKFGWMCLDVETWISTSVGPRQVKNLINVPYVAVVDGVQYPSSGFFEAGIKETIEIEAQGYELKCSPDHKIMTDVGWKKAGDLVIGDSLRVNDCGIKEWNGEGNWHEGYLIGMVIGDGTLQEDGSCSISSSSHVDGSHTIRDSIIQSLKKHNSIYRYLDHYNWKMPPSHENTQELRLACSSLSKLCEKYNVTFFNKTITTKIEEASSNFYKGFLRGLFDADGSVEKLGKRKTSRGVRLSQSNLPLLQSVQRMLARLNIQSRICQTEKSEWGVKDPYVLTIRSKSCRKFNYEIGFTNPNNRKLLDEQFILYESSRRLLVKVTKLKKSNSRQMYDCTVEGIHAYCANGIFVSNSNNSVLLDKDEDFDQLGEVAKRVIHNGEPGVINRRNLKFGRIGKSQNGIRPDMAVGFNPCGEIPLEHREVCNLSETLPTMCDSVQEWYKSCEYASFYSSTVSLLPTHQPSTNRVVARNRRIGVSLIDFTGWVHAVGVHKVTRYLRNGYNIVTETNKWCNGEAGVPEALRKTCVKPGGTTPKVPGKTSGAGYPTHKWTIRRTRVQQGIPFHDVLVRAGIPYEKDHYSKNTDTFEYPILQGPAKPAEEISVWQQAANIVLLQREWADNAVSNTIYFRPKWRLIEHYKKYEGDNVLTPVEEYIGYSTMARLVSEQKKEYIIPDTYKIVFIYGDGGTVVESKIYEFDPKHEEDDVEPVLSSTIPLAKSLALLPHTPKGVYKQMPEEGITEDEYNERLSKIEQIDWSELRGSDGLDERYCQGDQCELPMSS